MTDNNDTPAGSVDIMEILKTHGWSPDAVVSNADLKENPPVAEEEKLEVHEIPQESLKTMAPPPKERVRNTPGGLLDSGVEDERPAADPWSRYVNTIGTVKVTEDELESYTKALLFDTRFELPVRLLVGDQPFEVVIRSLYMSERETMALAVSKVAREYPVPDIQTAAVVADYYLKLAIMVQVVSINGEPALPYDARPGENQLPEECPKVDEMVRKVRLKYGSMHQAKLKALVKALHIFETKQQILEDAYYNRDFRRPADAN